MPPAKAKRSQGRTRRSVWADDQLWNQADGLAGATDGLTVGHALSGLLRAYANHTLTVPIPTEEVRSGTRGQHPSTIADAAWHNADKRRKAENIQSMSVLCELLLREWVEGRAAVGITADTAHKESQDAAPQPERIVTYREGIHRERYHVRADCPALTGQRETVDAWAACPESEAQGLDLTACQRCDR